MLHLHLTAIVISAVLFLVVFFMYKANNSPDNKPAKILHMVARLFYVIVLISGLVVYISNMEGISNMDGHMQYGIKVLLGLLSIGFMEMAIVRLKKSATVWPMVVALILIIATVIMGATLPLGILSF
ncbi:MULTISPECIES: DUF1516 family protein [Jeotgalicoccus]|uniref:DUF1516 family protein n=1 Tax=Jeotgalicoccus TaxID=227979 RepID=UPI0004788C3E|nr:MULTISPECIES: DUF1516 family protein [Jeotgalicoccus]QQD85931.1 DUF1516 family protein [Jeotgalicoccus sp. ATCC 8456]